MENRNIAVIDQQAPSTMNNGSLLLNGDVMDRMMKIADVMSQGISTVPKHLQGKPSDCLAIVMQAARWGMDPYVVGQKTHVINGTLGYEAQLVSAVLTATGAIRGRFHYEYRGEKDLMECRVGAVISGEKDITWNEWLCVSEVTIKNSPLWKSNPKQQIGYLQVKYWARAYTPWAILGVYTPDELEERVEREINPTQRMTVDEITRETGILATAQESATNVDAVADDLRDRIDTASSVDQAKAIRADIESQKALLGTALYTELKNKAVKRYYLVDAKNKVEAAINSLPNPGDPEAEALFAKAESTLTSSRRHLGDELYDQFRITLDDMKPEYVG
ncbi:TPA: enterohemolysin [Klebsiella pneumoniae MGH 78578]|uniref:Enterobacterial exodeoxyribonuclease VIII n=1 Tax=Klebsiella pneumoniae subsp. pneumoniae (strain ATCC 700721 / MGH 78578) TaxID=272620 RepID=A6T893_KLEP7|nr:recombinase RecT [Klebsiella pneumoniae]HBY9174478.1 enterohemolysin [Klebsiella pneumoniae MGH 78578]ABR76814.1 putative enterobacterial exodeoxyribonuclease VIII [Klebsiella pneumoniae subsp. pneumoniae MGH 78578]EIW8591247.1 enterohemolysin [Klebsiella pneumoniae]EIW8622122.1 enterohemolysin [Klebsiella pneumoniae]EIW9020133.1 enterohemolysin [Klebsiella pneumoniae]